MKTAAAASSAWANRAASVRACCRRWPTSGASGLGADQPAGAGGRHPLHGTVELDPFGVRGARWRWWRILMPVDGALSAGRESMSDELQALCFAAGAIRSSTAKSC